MTKQSRNGISNINNEIASLKDGMVRNDVGFMKIKNFKLKIIGVFFSFLFFVPCYLFLVTSFTVPAFAQNALVNYGQQNQTPTSNTVTPSPTSDSQTQQSQQNPILTTIASVASYIITLGNPVHFDKPKQSFSPAEKPSFTLHIPTKDQANIGKSKTDTWQTSDEMIQAKLVSKANNAEIPALIQKNAAGQFEVTVKTTENMPHGDYSLKVDAKESFVYTRDLTQDFSWGVIAVNTNKSIYAPNEKVSLAFGLLDQTGANVCSGTITATITDPRGNVTTLSTSNHSIIRTTVCGVDYYTTTPDYQSSYQANDPGIYQMHVIADNHHGTHTLDDYFEVKETTPFDVERTAFPSRIYPAIPYPVKLTIKANQDYSGEVTDYVPKAVYLENISGDGTAPSQMNLADIVQNTDPGVLAQDAAAYARYNGKVSKLVHQLVPVITKDTQGNAHTTYETPNAYNVDTSLMPVVWHVDWKKGQTYTLSYTINFPFVSPGFYTLGPFTIGDTQQPVFKEARQWQIASDAIKCWIGTTTSWSGSNWVAQSGSTATTISSGDTATFDSTTTTCTGGVSTNNNSTIDASFGGTIGAINILTYTGTITQAKALTVSGTYSQSATGSTFNGATQSISVAGLTVSAGTFTATSGTLTDTNTWNTVGGTFNANSGTVVFDSSTAFNITPSTETYNNVTFQRTGGTGSATYTIVNNALIVGGTLKLDYNTSFGTTNINSSSGGSISAQGDISLPSTGTTVDGSVVVTINGTGTQTMTGVSSGASGSGAIPSVIVNKPSGTLNIRNVVTIIGGGTGKPGSLTWTQGSLDATGSTLVFDATCNACTGSGTISPGAVTFNNVTFDRTNGGTGGATYTISGGAFIVGGTLTLTYNSSFGSTVLNTSNGGSISAQGDITSSSSSVGGNVPITLSGSGNQTITQSGSNTFPTGSWTINKSGGTATLASGLTINNSSQSLTISGGTLDLAGFPVTIGSSGSLTINGGTLKVQGAELIRAGTATLNSPSITGGTVNYTGTGTYAKMILGTNYYNLTISGSGSWTAATSSAVLGNFTVSAGSYTAPPVLTVGGNFQTSGGTFTNNSGAVVFNDASQINTITGTNTFYDLTVTTPGKTIVFPASTTTTISHALTLQGTPNARVTLQSSSPGTQATLTASGSYTVSALDVKDSNVCASAVTPLSPSFSLNSGNNSCWSFNVAANWYNSSWLYRKEIIINHTKVAADQTNFPVLVTWTSDANVAAHTQSAGQDILFTAADGTTLMDYEIENFVHGTGELEAWIRIPTLSSSVDTVLWMYYGNPSATDHQNKTGVWNSNYKGVWHFSENAANKTVNDSTSNTNTATSNSNTSAMHSSSGQIDGAFNMNGSTDKASIADNASIDISSGDMTVSIWYNDSFLGNFQSPFDKSSSGSNRDYTFQINGATSGWWAIGNTAGNAWTSTDSFAAGVWHYLVITRSGTTATCYIDGKQEFTRTFSGTTNSGGALGWGNSVSGGQNFSGLLDEARILNTALPLSWIQTEYNNQSSPSTFLSFPTAPVSQIFGGVHISGGTSIKSN